MLEEQEDVKLPLRTRGRTPSTRSGIVPIWVAFLPPDLVKNPQRARKRRDKEAMAQFENRKRLRVPIPRAVQGAVCNERLVRDLCQWVNHVIYWIQANQNSRIRVTMERPKDVKIWSIERSNLLR